MNEMQMLKLVEQYSRNNDPVEGQVKVTRVPDWKSVYIETIDQVGRAIVMTEYKVDGNTYRAGYSQRSDTVFVSLASRA
jgi:hypothetical protein